MNAPLKKADAEIPEQIPSRVPEEFIPVWLWLKDNGTQWLVTIAVAVLLAVGVTVFFRHRDSQSAAAAKELLAQPTIEALEKTVADYGNTLPGIGAKLKLAKAYCDAAQYDRALSEYDAFIENHADYPFADVARVGRGFALCGLNRIGEASEVFNSFRTKNPGHYLAQQVVFGEATCLTLQGKKDAAKELLQELRAANRETPWDSAAKRMEGVVDRYQPGQSKPMSSLLEQANAMDPMPSVTTPPMTTPAPAPAATPGTPPATP